MKDRDPVKDAIEDLVWASCFLASSYEEFGRIHPEILSWVHGEVAKLTTLSRLRRPATGSNQTMALVPLREAQKAAQAFLEAHTRQGEEGDEG